MGMSYAPLPPRAFQKAMVFVDGTNLFYRLAGSRLRVSDLKRIFPTFLERRQISRIYFYTVEQHLAKAKSLHGEGFFDGIRVVLGDGIPTADGNVKEKGVDALLVADLIYHAATRNCEYALVVTTDIDFVHALRRVEDFGCGTGVLALCAEAPQRLRNACDQCFEVTADQMLERGWAVRA
jgi:uncharacterized LabA/DUF88 family protein